MPDFPAHASPGLPPHSPPRPDHQRSLSHLKLDQGLPASVKSASIPPLVTPSISPPATPKEDPFDTEVNTSAAGTSASSQPTDQSTSLQHESNANDLQPEQPAPELLSILPEVSCEVRARIPTTTGQEMFLHLYSNNADSKEHLAIVFGPHIRSKSLDEQRPGETEKDRMIRGAYTGTLYPGRTSSRIDALKREAGVGRGAKAGTLAGTHGTTGGDVAGDAAEKSDGHERDAGEGVVSTTTTATAGDSPDLSPPLVRIHSECYTGETVWSARCDCGEQLDEAARLMSLPASTNTHTTAADSSSLSPPPTSQSTSSSPSSGGVIIYLRQEGRGIGLLSKLKAYNLQDLGADTMQANLLLRHPADARSYGLATAMLLDLDLGGERGIRLLTNNPEKVRAVEGPGREVRVVERVPMIPIAWSSGGKEGVRGPEVERYISTKIEKFKHMFSS